MVGLGTWALTLVNTVLLQLELLLLLSVLVGSESFAASAETLWTASSNRKLLMEIPGHECAAWPTHCTITRLRNFN